MKYNGKNFDEVIEAHKMWLKTEGMKGSYADFSYCDCSCLVFSFLNLDGANFRKADLSESAFCNDSIRGACFDGANLKGTRFLCSDICHCTFKLASFKGTVFGKSDLNNCDFGFAYFEDAQFHNTVSIGNCHFDDADMKNVIIESQNFYNNDGLNEDWVRDGKIKKISACPDTGDFIGWKKVYIRDLRNHGGVVTDAIAKLEIPEKAKRSSAFGRKCRASEAKVLGMWPIIDDKPDFEHPIDVAQSCYDSGFKYAVGEIVRPQFAYCENPYEECASGIHFFITMQEALDY